MMTKKQIRDRDETIAQFAMQINHHGIPGGVDSIEELVDWLHRQETTLHRLAELACDRELTRAEQAKNDRIEGRVRDLLALYHVPVRFEGDPRGGTIRMKFVSGASNNWGGEDWGIYW
jgi:hypothetical protein